MKRDLDLMRQIMLDLEGSDDYHTDIASLYPDKDSEAMLRITWHLRLLEDAGYVVLGPPCLCGYPNYPVELITNNGYEFIRLTQDKTAWEKARDKIIELGAIASTPLLQKIIEKLIN